MESEPIGIDKPFVPVGNSFSSDGDIAAVEADARGGETIDIRRFYFGVPVVARLPPSLIVSHDDDDVRRVGRLLGSAETSLKEQDSCRHPSRAEHTGMEHTVGQSRRTHPLQHIGPAPCCGDNPAKKGEYRANTGQRALVMFIFSLWLVRVRHGQAACAGRENANAFKHECIGFDQGTGGCKTAIRRGRKATLGVFVPVTKTIIVGCGQLPRRANQRPRTRQIGHADAPASANKQRAILA